MSYRAAGMGNTENRRKHVEGVGGKPQVVHRMEEGRQVPA